MSLGEERFFLRVLKSVFFFFLRGEGAMIYLHFSFILFDYFFYLNGNGFSGAWLFSRLSQFSLYCPSDGLLIFPDRSSFKLKCTCFPNMAMWLWVESRVRW